jgi:Xaa-Pro aminopeptidase
MEKRINRARQYLKGLDAILLVSRPSVTYLSGYTGSDGVFLFTDMKAFLFVDSRNTLQAQEESGDEVHEIVKRWEGIYAVLQEEGVRHLGIESNIIDFDSFMQMRDVFKGIEMTPIGKQLKFLRMIKDEAEVELLSRAVQISEQALESVLKKGLVGRTEKAVALDFEWEMRTRGASAASFDLIIAAGPRSAMPHGTASDRKIEPNEAVVIDFGCTYNGYCSDQTITVTTGKMEPAFEEAYHQVLEAQQKAIKAVSPGIQASAVDKIAREHLKNAGLGSYFGHGLGHGVGMEVHEAPTVSYLSEDILGEGMVITIEPGVYIPGKYGIRLEDMVLITDNSCKLLTNLDKCVIRLISQR